MNHAIAADAKKLIAIIAGIAVIASDCAEVSKIATIPAPKRIACTIMNTIAAI